MITTQGLGDTGQSAVETMQRVAGTTLDDAQSLARRGAYAVRDRSQQWRDAALDASASGVGFVRRNPLETLSIALAAGVLTLAVMTFLRRRR